MEKTWLEFVVIGGYLGFLILVSYSFKHLSRDASDFFRSGCRCKWWLAGMSSFMTAFSAWTFTGAAGVAYEAGWSALILFSANVAGFLVNVAILAPWFRQLRSISPPEIIRKRFGIATQQFYAWITVLTQICYSSLHLYGLAIFSSAIFGFSVQHIIFVLGIVVLIYSMIGGSWGVMASDFIQACILMPMTILLAILCLIKVGGVGGLFDVIKSSGLSADYSIFKDASRFQSQYTYFWAAVLFLNNVLAFNSLTNATKYFAVKDGTEARKTALLTAILMFIGTLVWFIPPMISRFYFSDIVNSMNIAKPAEAAYAIASMKLLPMGMMGLMVVAIFSATTSSMDSGLNRNAAVFTNDIYPAISKLLGLTPTTDGRNLMMLGRGFTVLLGIMVIILAYYLSRHGEGGIFQYMLDLGAMLMVPLMMPMVWGLFIKRVPAWAALFSIGCAFVASALGALSGKDFAIVQSISWLKDPWLWQVKAFVNIVTGSVAFIIPGIFWNRVGEAYRKHVDIFFTTMHTPVDFEKEVGFANDSKQAFMVGGFCVLLALAISLLLFVPNQWAWFGRYSILFIAGIILVVGLVLLGSSYRENCKSTKIEKYTEEHCKV